ncbi:hypothetical protein AV530_001158 [Patagioenas fasciata monilis]|uniref:Uncharacterized protein n=1 Tax=Patagioenas fasciata monilis TaxID=372326 RepID=A0A1V4KTF3_PATFA|nr:hypothetical protein AV530_001158 [Patagioenas fasciata monilis]
MGKIVTTGQEMWGLAAYRKTTNEWKWDELLSRHTAENVKLLLKSSRHCHGELIDRRPARCSQVAEKMFA